MLGKPTDGLLGGTNAAITALANPGIQVAVVDIDNATIDRWNSKHLPIEEPGLDFVVCIARDGLNKRAPVEPQRAANLVFSTDCKKHISEADVVFLTVSTRTKDHGVGAGSTIDVKYLKAAVEIVAMVAKPGVIIVEKSTVPCKTAQMIGDMVGQIQRCYVSSRTNISHSYTVPGLEFLSRFFLTPNSSARELR